MKTRAEMEQRCSAVESELSSLTHEYRELVRDYTDATDARERAKQSLRTARESLGAVRARLTEMQDDSARSKLALTLDQIDDDLSTETIRESTWDQVVELTRRYDAEFKRVMELTSELVAVRLQFHNERISNNEGRERLHKAIREIVAEHAVENDQLALCRKHCDRLKVLLLRSFQSLLWSRGNEPWTLAMIEAELATVTREHETL